MKKITKETSVTAAKEIIKNQKDDPERKRLVKAVRGETSKDNVLRKT
ncbi:MAG: hypothetical protein ACE5FU_07430 [Nitrospinota bacterium]